MLLLALLIVLVAWLQLRRWVEVLIGDIRGKRFLDDAKSPRSSMPILSQVRQVLAEAEEKQRLEIDFRENWTPQALQQVVRDHLHSAAGDHRVESRALHPQLRRGSPSGGAGPGQRHGDGARAHHARLLGHLGGARQRHGRSRGGGPNRSACACRPDDPTYTLRRVWLTAGAGGGLLLRILQRRPVAAVPSGLRAAGLSRERLARLSRQSIANSPRSWRAEVGTDDPVILIQDFHFALLPQLHPRRRAEGDHRAVLAHPLAECRNLRRLPVEARDAARTC